MGWVWRNDGDDSEESRTSPPDDFTRFENPNLSLDNDRCSTRTVVRSNCKTEEVAPGKFIRKCEKTEQVLRDCLGRPTEILKSNKEYTEEEVTNQAVRGSYAMQPFDTPFNFPGLRSDIEALEREFFGGINRFFEFFKHDGQSSSSPSIRQGVPIEGPEMGASPKPKQPDSGLADLSGLARDV
ncbi:Mal d 1-associated protein [Melia azedarach]|uniref:Mal d 1-associated protein n=1 Tax=Melia azedarach TaxID=155640 RepID=A0ACC1X2L6_MELAZ|nr:Mal d 1-associated protein [Melia azedarach]